MVAAISLSGGKKKRERVLPVMLINLSALICLYPPERSPRCGPTHTQQPHQHENMWRSPLIRPSTSENVNTRASASGRDLSDALITPVTRR